MQVQLESQNDSTFIFRLSGRITQRTLRKFTDPLEQLGEEAYQRVVLFNMADAEFIDSSGVNWILAVHKQCREAGGRLVLHSIPKLVHNVLMVLRMNEVLEFAEDETSAIQQGQQPPDDKQSE